MQQAISVTLPGGLQDQGVLQRHAEFKSVTGWLEQFVYSSGHQDNKLPQCVSEILSEALQGIGNKAVDTARASSMCVADRQYLMLCLSRLICGDNYWLQCKCKKCNENFDVNIKQSELPIQQAGEGFPFVSVRIGRYTLKLRTPTGHDQEAILDLDRHEATKTLLYRCIVDLQPDMNRSKFVDGLSEADIETIDTALDKVSPSIGTSIQTNCPECKASQILVLDPYHLIKHQPIGLYQDIHRIAYCYHWSEQEILSLPKPQRQLYLRMIDSTQGVQG